MRCRKNLSNLWKKERILIKTYKMSEIDEAQNSPTTESALRGKSLALVKSPLLLSSLLLAIVFGGTSSILYLAQYEEEVPLPISSVTFEKKNPFDATVVSARAAFVYDIRNKREIFAKNAEQQLPLASIAKLMTALVAEENLEQGSFVTISSEAIAESGDSGFFNGERWSVKDLIDFTLMTSSNDGAAALALAVDKPVTVAFNKKADKLGLVQSYFANSTGLDNGGNTSGSYGSARDVAELLTYILVNNPELIEATRYETLSFISQSAGVHLATNTNKSIRNIPALIGGKTGFTDLAGGNLAFAFDAGLMRPMIVVVLGSTEDGRFEDAEKLVDATLEYLRVFE
jgi:serine-type D-Ala-D-Ala carboxypeptidase (penicillin-binding protein 5/6)